MTDSCDILLHMIQEQWAQARQSENQRAMMSNFIIVIAVGVFAFLAHTQPGLETMLLASLITVLGLFGAVVSAKLYERFNLHVHRVGRMMRRLDELSPDATLRTLEKEADSEHKHEFPVLSGVRLHWLWLMLHIGVSLTGVTYVVIQSVR